jgi:hypothetical protein
MITVQNPDGLGIIDIVSDGFLYCLKIDRIVAADSYDNGGTVAHYYELAGYNRKDIAAIAGRMNKLLMEGSSSAVEEQIREFLLLFAPGEYEIEVDQTTSSYDFASGNYYPTAELNINLTQHARYLDEKRISFYMNAISNGMNPRLVLFNKNWRYYNAKSPEDYNDDSFHFLLDGHHKLMAYNRLQRPIHYVLIRGFFPDTLSPAYNAALFLEALPVLTPHFRDFLLLENMQVLTDDSANTLHYNRLLDEAIAESERPGMGLMHKLKTLGDKGTEAEKNWAVARLDALYNSFTPGCKARTFFYLGAGSTRWEQLSCDSREAYDNWCVRYFGMRYPNYRTRILFGR